MEADENTGVTPEKVAKLLRGASRLDKCRVCGCFQSAVIMIEDDQPAPERWPEVKEAWQAASLSFLPVRCNCNGREHCLPVESLKTLRAIS